MAMQTTWTEQVNHHFVNFNRELVNQQAPQPLGEDSKRASDSMTVKLARLNQLDSFMAPFEKERETLKEDIKAYMGSCTLLVDANGVPLVSYKPQTKTTLDQPKFKAARPELFAMYSKQTSVRPFRII